MYNKFKSTLVSIIVGAMFAAYSASPALAVDPIVGKWTGTADQPGYGSYGVEMELSSLSAGSTNYPSLSCGGSLSGGGSGGVYNFRESITYGKATETSGGCIDGNIRVVLQGNNRLFWEWRGSYKGQDYYASGKLTRSGPPPATKTCNECGQALMNDLYYGLQQSQGVRNYVHEAWQNYGNCTLNIPGRCENACVTLLLYKNIPSCNHFDDTGYKACVNSLLEGAQRECQ